MRQGRNRCMNALPAAKIGNFERNAGACKFTETVNGSQRTLMSANTLAIDAVPLKPITIMPSPCSASSIASVSGIPAEPIHTLQYAACAAEWCIADQTTKYAPGSHAFLKNLLTQASRHLVSVGSFCHNTSWCWRSYNSIAVSSVKGASLNCTNRQAVD